MPQATNTAVFFSIVFTSFSFCHANLKISPPQAVLVVQFFCIIPFYCHTALLCCRTWADLTASRKSSENISRFLLCRKIVARSFSNPDETPSGQEVKKEQPNRAKVLPYFSKLFAPKRSCPEKMCKQHGPLQNPPFSYKSISNGSDLPNFRCLPNQVCQCCRRIAERVSRMPVSKGLDVEPKSQTGVSSIPVVKFCADFL